VVFQLLRLEDVFIITGRGTVITGRLEYGSFLVHDIITIGGKHYIIKGVEQFRKALSALPGDNIGILINADKDEIKKNLKDICDIRDKSDIRDEKIDSILNGER